MIVAAAAAAIADSQMQLYSWLRVTVAHSALSTKLLGAVMLLEHSVNTVCTAASVSSVIV
jgi:hypothetical protein